MGWESSDVVRFDLGSNFRISATILNLGRIGKCCLPRKL